MTIKVPVEVSLIGAEETKRALSELGKMAAEVFAVSKLLDYAKTGIEEFSEMRIASAELTETLGKQATSLIKLAEVSSKNSKYKATEIAQGEEILAQYHLTEAQISQLIPTMLNLAVKTGSVEEASRLLGMSVEKGTNVLSRYGINVTGVAGSQDRVTSAMNETYAVLGDLNKAYFDTMNPLEKMNKLMVESSSTIGEVLVPQINDMYDTLPEFKQVLGAITKSIATVVQAFAMGMNTVALTTIAAIDGIITLVDKIPGHPKFLDGWKSSLDDTLKALEISEQGYYDTIVKIWGEAEEKMTKPKKRSKSSGFGGGGETDEQKAEVKHQQEVMNEINKIKEEGYLLGLDEKQQEIVKLDMAYNEEMILLKGHLQAQNLLTEEYNEKKAGLVKDLDDEQKKEQIKAQEEVVNIYYDSEEEKADLIAGSNNRQLALMRVHYERLKSLAAINGKSVETILVKQKTDEVKFEKKTNLQKLEFGADLAKQTLSTMSEVADASKANAQVKKRISEGEAIIDGAKAVIGIWATSSDMGQPAGSIFAGIETALVVATTAAQVAKIESTKFAYGGVATGGIPGRDSIPASLSPGEIVYNPAHPNPALASMINSGNNSMSSETHIHFASPQVHIHGSPDTKSMSKMTQALEESFTRQTHKALQVLTSRGKMPGTTVFK